MSVRKKRLRTKHRATAKLLAIDSSARFLVFDGRGRGPASKCLETNCPCYHMPAGGEPLGFILTEPAFKTQRSEERRVGKECKSRGGSEHEQKRKKDMSV